MTQRHGKILALLTSQKTRSELSSGTWRHHRVGGTVASLQLPLGVLQACQKRSRSSRLKMGKRTMDIPGSSRTTNLRPRHIARIIEQTLSGISKRRKASMSRRFLLSLKQKMRVINFLQRKFAPTNGLQQTRHQHNPGQPENRTAWRENNKKHYRFDAEV